MGVSKAFHDKGSGLQRLIENVIPSNHVQHVIEGDMDALVGWPVEVHHFARRGIYPLELGRSQVLLLCFQTAIGLAT
eukprot:2143402-Karenia_brevis.AAC.1